MRDELKDEGEDTIKLLFVIPTLPPHPSYFGPPTSSLIPPTSSLIPPTSSLLLHPSSLLLHPSSLISVSQTSSLLKAAVFCDFDGTITAEETFVGMLKEFNPQLSAQLMPQMYARTLTLRAGVRQLLESIPSSCYPEIVAYAKTKAIRPGLGELLDFLAGEGVPFIVVSGGLRCMVETTLNQAGVRSQVAAVYAVDLDSSAEFLQVNSPFEAGTEMVSKVQVMALHPACEQIAIGDSVTDLNMALAAPVVFARDRLSQYLDEHNKPYLPWHDFFDVRYALQQRWQDR